MKCIAEVNKKCRNFLLFLFHCDVPALTNLCNRDASSRSAPRAPHHRLYTAQVPEQQVHRLFLSRSRIKTALAVCQGRSHERFHSR